MNSPLYAVAQHFAQGGYADGGAVDETYVNGQLVPGGVQAGYSVAGATRPTPTMSSFDRMQALRGNVNFGNLRRMGIPQEQIGRLQNMQNMRALRANQMQQPMMQMQNNRFRRSSNFAPQPSLAQTGAPVQNPMPTPAPAPTSPGVAVNYEGMIPMQASSGWYGQAPAAPQAYAQGGVVSSGSDIMDALASMGYNPYGG